MKSILVALVTVSVVSLWAQPGAAPLQVLASNGMRTVVEDLKPQAEKAAGRPIVFQWATSTVIKEKISKGESFDAAIITTDVVTALINEKKLAATKTDLARCGIGLGIRSGAPKPDIHTADALKRTLLNAKSITYASAGASAPHLARMFERMGIADAIKPKLALEPDSVRSNALVASGQSDIIMTLISEIITVKGVDLVGPLPADYQNYVSFAAAVSPGSKNAEAAKAFIKVLAGPAAEASLKANGMER